MTISKSFTVDRAGRSPIRVVGFTADSRGGAFVDLNIGRSHDVACSAILDLDHARALVAALSDAINHADLPREASAADLGIAA